MDIDLFFVREKILAKHLQILHVPDTDQQEDAMTKSFPSARFMILKHKFRVVMYKSKTISIFN